MSDYKNPTCKGSVLFRTACGVCERCVAERAQIQEAAVKFLDNPATAKPLSEIGKLRQQLALQADELASLKRDNAALRTALSEYGQHRLTCFKHGSKYCECTCGYDEFAALRGTLSIIWRRA